jgi:uncharacterized protein with GYD domain
VAVLHSNFGGASRVSRARRSTRWGGADPGPRIDVFWIPDAAVHRCIREKNYPGRYAMATYIALCNWTDRGAQQVKDSPRRFDAAKKLLRDMGGDIKQFYLTMGDFDLVAIAEAPDDAVMARFLMQLGMLGNVRTRTLKAFPESAYREIVASLS